ncbi:uncharacterized protein MYCFIDRAFT_175842 [Pseudocercospora fijiensis CIRAD86]|uniref:Uncharacterized protein n=1 Tax=Pseudocercospora fijiensis (strain CIRAD86) TaxID=383855 RepID=M3AYQ6_PSEFD|nr:uncharacterized protein MYCFIDRAFT_175842 [Pseudocercospora fijiensis CIRAD86]EME82293.1 hypothetical protein MYCFIDRAFT_175842 [Pseudocercospora fijiensis CIRAD86]
MAKISNLKEHGGLCSLSGFDTCISFLCGLCIGYNTLFRCKWLTYIPRNIRTGGYEAQREHRGLDHCFVTGRDGTTSKRYPPLKLKVITLLSLAGKTLKHCIKMAVSSIILTPSVAVTTELLTSVVTRKPKPTAPSTVDPVTLVVTATRSRYTTSSTTAAHSSTRLSSTKRSSYFKITSSTRLPVPRSTLSSRSISSRTTRHNSTPSTSTTIASSSKDSTTLHTAVLSTTSSSPTPSISSTPAVSKSGPPLDRTAVTAGITSIVVVILLITAGTILYKFRLRLKLKFTRNKTEHHVRDVEDQPSTHTNVVEKKHDDDVELKPISASSSKAESDEKLPVEHVRPLEKRRSSSVYSTDSLSSDCSEYAGIWSRQIEAIDVAGFDIIKWHGPVCEISRRSFCT